jgi:hypothetical protein
VELIDDTSSINYYLTDVPLFNDRRYWTMPDLGTSQLVTRTTESSEVRSLTRIECMSGSEGERRGFQWN